MMLTSFSVILCALDSLRISRIDVLTGLVSFRSLCAMDLSRFCHSGIRRLVPQSFIATLNLVLDGIHALVERRSRRSKPGTASGVLCSLPAVPWMTTKIADNIANSLSPMLA